MGNKLVPGWRLPIYDSRKGTYSNVKVASTKMFKITEVIAN